MNPQLLRNFPQVARNLLLMLATLALLGLAAVGAQAQTPAQNRAQTQAPNAEGAATPAYATPRVRVTQAVDENQLVVLPGRLNPLAKPSLDRGLLSDGQPITRMHLVLQRSPQQETALRQLLDDQQNRSHRQLSRLAHPATVCHAVRPGGLGRSGRHAMADHARISRTFKVGEGKTAIEFSGNVGQLREAFHTDVHKFLLRGQVRNANVSDPQIPAALSPVIAGVVGLSNFRPRAHVHRLGTFRRTKGTHEAKPLFTFMDCGPNGTLQCYAVGPGDFAKIYSVPAMVGGQPAGKNQTIVVVGDSNVNPADFNDFRTLFGLPNMPLQVVVNGPDPGISGPDGDEIEADLDTQTAGGVAPNAQIVLVVTEQPDSGVGAAGVDLSVLYAINNNLAPVVSKSFGECEPFLGASGNQLEAPCGNRLPHKASPALFPLAIRVPRRAIPPAPVLDFSLLAKR